MPMILERNNFINTKITRKDNFQSFFMNHRILDIVIQDDDFGGERIKYYVLNKNFINN